MKRTKKGFTITEVVIAVLIAVAVSVMALSVILSTDSTTKEAVSRHTAAGQVTALLECFKAANDNLEMLEAVQVGFGEMVTGLDSSETEYKLYFYFDESGKLATLDTSVEGRPEKYEMVVYVRILCNADGDFRNGKFFARAFKAPKEDSGLEMTDENLLVYEMQRSYVKGMGIVGS